MGDLNPKKVPMSQQMIWLNRISTISGDTVVLTVSGAIDLLTSDEFEEQLKSVLSPPYTVVVLDLSGVTFLSSAGLSVLLSGAESAKSSNISFRLVTNERVVLRPLEITGVSEAVSVYDSVDAALMTSTE